METETTTATRRLFRRADRLAALASLPAEQACREIVRRQFRLALVYAVLLAFVGVLALLAGAHPNPVHPGSL